MKLHYYPETDSAYIDFNEGIAAETHVIVDGLNADMDVAWPTAWYRI